MLTNNTPFEVYFNTNVNADSIYQSDANKDGRHYTFLSFTTLDGEAKTALVSEAAQEAYDAEDYSQLEVANIVDDNGVVSNLLSICKRGANKTKKVFTFMAANK